MSEVISICPRAAQNRESALTFDCCPIDNGHWTLSTSGISSLMVALIEQLKYLSANRRKISMKA